MGELRGDGDPPTCLRGTSTRAGISVSPITWTVLPLACTKSGRSRSIRDELAVLNTPFPVSFPAVTLQTTESPLRRGLLRIADTGRAFETGVSAQRGGHLECSLSLILSLQSSVSRQLGNTGCVSRGACSRSSGRSATQRYGRRSSHSLFSGPISYPRPS